MKRLAIVVAFGLISLACSSGGSGGTTTTGAGGGSTGTGTATGSQTATSSAGTGGHQNVCVLTTDMGNSKGVGKYCTPGGMQYNGLEARLCTADVAESEWFCVKVGCKVDGDCAEMATCVKQMGSSGCVPNKCLQGAGGAGGGGGKGGAGGK